MGHYNIVIVGCGRLGSELANQLSTEGHHITVIDRHPSLFKKLAFDFGGYTVVGDATELRTLKDAKVADADYLFATTSEDNTNIMVAQVARSIFEVEHVVARVYDPAREAMYGEFGIETISPIKLSSDAFIDLLTHKQPTD